MHDEGLPQPGDVFAGKYQIDRVLGRGGMGVVFAARHLQLEENVALKVLLPSLAGDAFTERFMREGRAAARIRGEHVTRVLDVGKDDRGVPYLVMEFLEGEDLASLLQRHGPLPMPMVVDCVVQVCEALAEAHGLGIVHRDLKPANLFLTTRPDGSYAVKVLDFGISKMTSGPGREALTQTSSALGSPLYMSPEQLRSAKHVDARTDIWALGIAMYELLTGTPPFIAQSVPELIVKILEEPTPSLRSLRGDIPEPLSAVAMRALSKRLEDRWSNVAEMATALAPFASPHGVVSVDRVVRIHSRSGVSRREIMSPPSSGQLPVTGPGPGISRPGIGTTGSSISSGFNAPVPSSPRPNRSAIPVIMGAAGLLLLFGSVALITVLKFAGAKPERAAASSVTANVETPAPPPPAPVEPQTAAPVASAAPVVSDAGAPAAEAAPASKRSRSGSPRTTSPHTPAPARTADSRFD
jgi:serine/threonine protein kinase